MGLIFFKFYGCLLAGLAILYAIGSLVFYLLKIKIQNLYLNTFTKLVMGITIFVVVTSAFFTHGKTINIGFLILGLSFLAEYFRNKKETLSALESTKIDFIQILKHVFEILLVVSTLFALKFYNIYSNSGIPIIPGQDYVVYSNLSDYLMEVGKENTAVDYIYSNNTGVSPYHYFEIWSAAGLFEYI